MLEKAHNSGYEVKLDKEYAPLLGTIKCPICGGNLTASSSLNMKKRKKQKKLKKNKEKQ